jgi:hypothetical protein
MSTMIRGDVQGRNGAEAVAAAIPAFAAPRATGLILPIQILGGLLLLSCP